MEAPSLFDFPNLILPLHSPHSHSQKDAKGYLAIFHEDFTFLSHQSGKTTTLKDWEEPKIQSMMEKITSEKMRCIYENDEILVMHAFNTYGSGDREALMQVSMLKGGKILSMETGASPLPKAETA